MSPARGRSSTTGTTYAACAVLALAILAVYWQTGKFDFTNYDDNQYVAENRHAAGGLTFANIAWALSSGHAGNWHPLTWVSHLADVSLFGLRPGGHHLVNVFFHAANTLLLLAVLTVLTGHFWRSAFVAALFALHPLHVESVAWVSERKDVLSTFFWMLTMLAYVGYVRHPRAARYLLVIVLFALGLMSKPMLVSLPIVLLLLDWWPLGRLGVAGHRIQASQQTTSQEAGLTTHNSRPATSLLLEKLPLFVLAAASCVVTYLVQKESGAVNPLDQYPLGNRLANAVVAYAGYLWKMVWPARLAVFYPRSQNLPPIWELAGAGLLLACLTYLAVRFGRRRPYVLVGWLWYVVTLIPVIGLVQVGAQSMADRYTYVPLIGPFVIVAWGVSELLPRRSWLLAGAGAAVLLTLSVCTYRQVGYWRNTVTLFSHALAVTRDSTVAHCNLAAGLQKQGRLDEAVEHYRYVVTYMPGQWEAEYGLGVVLSQQRKLDEAVAYYRRALELRPDHSMCRYNLGVALYQKGDTEGATAEYKRSLAIDPSNAKAHNNLGQILARQGMFHEAIAHYRAALRINPRSAAVSRNLAKALGDLAKLGAVAGQLREATRANPRDWRAQHDLAVALARQGKLDQAIACYRRSLSINPKYAADRYNLAVALHQKGDLDGAATEYEQALALDPSNSIAHSNLGVILAQRGKLDQAIVHCREAVRLAPNNASARNNLALALEMKAAKGR